MTKVISYSQAMEILGWIYSKNGLPYSYGGSGNPGGDCSWFVMAVAAALQGKARNVRYGSTETFRLASGQVLGLTRASSKSAVPTNAILKLGFYHNGGGYNSHTSGTFAGVNFESRGMYKGIAGHVVSGTARAWNDSLYHEWWYLDATMGYRGAAEFPLPSNFYYGPLSGPDESISGEAGGPSYFVEGLKEIQRKLGVLATGRWRDVAEHVKPYQQRAAGGLGPTNGHIGPKTWEAIMSPSTSNQETPMALSFDSIIEAVDKTKHRIVDLIRFTNNYAYRLHDHDVPRLERKIDQLTDQMNSLQARFASGDDSQQEQKEPKHAL
ncbi:hypothetical protein YH66_05365 [[Brevibacterium] flavum]|uniref:Uncharacterized protein n=1 Tax=[Brevibacterium] flavum TaxID=92706 RepID=A0A0F6WQA1_9CORY|nr:MULTISPECIES: hypothetical protein [Corynebacterium]AKF27023.1 hypothetical protein YH66_05365 [[Brevibacterium] flavum]ANE07846.1 hypothetical protein A3654_05350 [Corynebacterium glutamicum]AST20263.1 hypothetical protein CEY17_05420 [Corynebacterium glutamicum ATCC 14067]KEI22739.1 hypothetical protein KIQ_009205 [Corynebacterium glutamicum ATCC 14067]KIH74276.1 hypothetical protein SD36_05385 [Corynebacterium glutamicum]